jgi:signal transduction histidine kinase
MTPLRQWLRPPKALLLLLFLLTFASVSTLATFGWRLLEQQRMVEAQRSQDRLEHAADRIAALVRETLEKSSERLGAGLVSPGDLLLTLSATSLNATPPGRLLYYPVSPPDPEPHSEVFAEPELFEFVESQPTEALRGFERLAHSADASVRAGALLRIARVLRNSGQREHSIAVYRKLAGMNENVAGVPGSLLAALAIGALSRSAQAALDLRNNLSSGRWRLTRGQFEFYWSEAGRLTGNPTPPPVENRRLTQIAEFVWNDRMNHPESRGYETEWIAGAPILLIWRGTPEQRRVLVARPESLVQESPPGADVRYAFVDAKGHTLAGVKDGSNGSVVRTAAESELPWTLFVWEKKPIAKNALIAQQRFLLLGLSIMMLFLVLGTYFIARAIQREAEVQRMQSNFVSAVSHEFRSPITSMRQLSEMLALGRVSSEERRQLYYETLVKETSRLQRLIEGLLNFGRMEAGARQYQFEEHDALVIVENVVREFAPQIGASGKHIEAVRTKGPLWIEADFDAISVALRNLLDNAIKYSPDQPTVWVECGLDQGRVVIRVRDQGLGIAESERRTIFKKFMRGSAAIAANVKGSGVGLAMVSHIMAAHGGEITVASELGRGSMFTMSFPTVERTCQEF